MTIISAKDVTFSALASLNAVQFVQQHSVRSGGIYTADDQAGTTRFGGTVTLSGTGTVLNLTGYNFIFDAPVNLATGSLQGLFNGVMSVNDTITLGGDLNLAAGALVGANPQVDLAASVTTSSGQLLFGNGAALKVRLLADTTLNTGAGGGRITFDGLVDSDATPRDLTLNSGGSVTLNGLVGSLNPLADLTTDAGGSLVLAGVGSRTIDIERAGGTGHGLEFAPGGRRKWDDV